MDAFFIYILKWAVCVALFYSCWSLLLRRETFHRLNRVLLVSFLLAGAVLPLIDFTAPADVPLAGTLGSIGGSAHFFVVASRTAEPAHTAGTEFASLWSALIVCIYMIGVGVAMGKYALNLLAVVRLIRRSRLAEAGNGLRICLNDEVASPVSWMRWIVISSDDLAAHGQTFLAHEAAHVRGRHSFELLLAEVCVRLQWYNPFAWMLLHDLRTVQEYEADYAALHSGADCEAYAHLLVTKAVGVSLPAANTFLRSPLKARVKMMMRPASRWVRSGRALFVLPVAAFALLLLAKPEVVQAVARAKTIEELPATILAYKPDKPAPAANEAHVTEVKAPEADTTATHTASVPDGKPLPPLTGEYIRDLIASHATQNRTFVMISSEDGSPLHSGKFDYYIDGRKCTPEELMQYTEQLDVGDLRVFVIAAKPDRPGMVLSITPTAYIQELYPDVTTGSEAVVQVFTNKDTFRALSGTPDAPSASDSLATKVPAKTEPRPDFGMFKATRIERE